MVNRRAIAQRNPRQPILKVPSVSGFTGLRREVAVIIVSVDGRAFSRQSVSIVVTVVDGPRVTPSARLGQPIAHRVIPKDIRVCECAGHGLASKPVNRVIPILPHGPVTLFNPSPFAG